MHGQLLRRRLQQGRLQYFKQHRNFQGKQQQADNHKGNRGLPVHAGTGLLVAENKEKKGKKTLCHKQPEYFALQNTFAFPGSGPVVPNGRIDGPAMELVATGVVYRAAVTYPENDAQKKKGEPQKYGRMPEPFGRRIQCDYNKIDDQQDDQQPYDIN